MKIRIIGSSGSGKTFVAKKISKKFKINHYDLDDIFWYKKYTRRRTENEIKDIISKILRKKHWIIEGIQYYNYNIERTFKDANRIIWINPNLIQTIYRLIKRLWKRRSGRMESVKDSLGLIKHATKYKLGLNSKSREAHKNYINKYPKKAVVLENNNEVNNFLGTLK